jgi:hypothetical protein
MRGERATLSRHAEVTKAIDYMLERWPALKRFLDDGRICLTNNAAERALRALTLGRRSWLFAGSERGAERAVVMYTLIQTAKLDDVDSSGLPRRRSRQHRRQNADPTRRPAAAALGRQHPSQKAACPLPSPDGYLATAATFASTAFSIYPPEPRGHGVTQFADAT